MIRPAPRVTIGAGSIARAAASARPSTLFADRLDAFKRANAVFVQTVGAPGGVTDAVADDLCSKAGDAYQDLIETPAPDLRSLAQKVDAVAAWNDGVQPKQDAADAIYSDASALLAAPSDNDPMEADWASIREAYQTGVELDTDPVEDAHQRILAARPTTNRGAMIQLLVGVLIDHGVEYEGMDIEAAILAEDYATLSAWEEAARFDWGPRFTVRALCTLASMEGLA